MREGALHTALNLSSLALDHFIITGAIRYIIKRAITKEAIYLFYILMAGIIFAIPIFKKTV